MDGSRHGLAAADAPLPRMLISRIGFVRRFVFNDFEKPERPALSRY
jgi:hypothetical protein